MKSFARFFLFGLVAASFPAAIFILAAEIIFPVPWHPAAVIAILCAQAVYFLARFSRRSRRGKPESSAEAGGSAKSRPEINSMMIGSAAGGVCAVALFFAALSHILEMPGKATKFDRAKMEGLAAQVRNQDFNGIKEFYWTDVSGAPVLSSTAVAGYRRLWADRAEDKNLKLVIWTNGGDGASLVYGFAYSDVPLAADGTPTDALAFFTSGPNSVIAHPAAPAFDVPGLDVTTQIDAHWWAVCDELNSH